MARSHTPTRATLRPSPRAGAAPKVASAEKRIKPFDEAVARAAPDRRAALLSYFKGVLGEFPGEGFAPLRKKMQEIADGSSSSME